MQLGLAFDAYKENRGRGFGPVGDMSRLGVLPTAQGYNLLVEYLGQAQAGDVLAVDVGSAVSSLSASVDGAVYTTIRTDLGLGHSAYNMLETLDHEAIRRWLPFLYRRWRPGGVCPQQDPAAHHGPGDSL